MQTVLGLIKDSVSVRLEDRFGAEMETQRGFPGLDQGNGPCRFGGPLAGV